MHQRFEQQRPDITSTPPLRATAGPQPRGHPDRATRAHEASLRAASGRRRAVEERIEPAWVSAATAATHPVHGGGVPARDSVRSPSSRSSAITTWTTHLSLRGHQPATNPSRQPKSLSPGVPVSRVDLALQQARNSLRDRSLPASPGRDTSTIMMSRSNQMVRYGVRTKRPGHQGRVPAFPRARAAAYASQHCA